MVSMLRIRDLRHEFKYTQEELGKKIGQKKSNISKYETGALEPGIDTLRELSKVFNVSLDFLMGNSDIRNPYNEDKDKYKEVDDVEEAMKVILEQPGLMLKGSILSDESKIILANAIQMGLRTAEELEKKKNEGDSNE